MPRENEFQTKLIKELRARFQGAIVLKNDPNFLQGIPDLLILFENGWAALETKRENNSGKRPNQEYYVNLMDEMSFAAFINPDNKDQILDELESAFRTRRAARLFRRE